MKTLTIDDMYVAYAHLAGQVTVATNLAAALAALHPEHRRKLDQVMAMTLDSDEYKHPGSTAEAQAAYADGMRFAVSVFRAAMAGMNPEMNLGMN